MIKYLVFLVVMLTLGLLLLYGYRVLFRVNSENALKNRGVLFLPDLNDLVITFISLMVIGVFCFSMNDVAEHFRKDVGSCVVEDVAVTGVPDSYELCINQYDAIIFKDQEEALNDILLNHETTIDMIMMDSSPISTDYYDNIYYLLQNNQNSDAKKELYLLLSIYRNFFETKGAEAQ